jgi:type IV secretory pathway VirJ component
MIVCRFLPIPCIRRIAAALLLGLTAPVFAQPPVPTPETLRHGRFESLALSRPASSPTDLVVYFPEPIEHRPGAASGRPADDNTRRIASAEDAMVISELLGTGAAVVTVDTTAFLRTLAQDGGDCAYAGGDVENLAHFIEAYLRMNTYQHPVLLGRGRGAQIAQAIDDQSPPGVISGVIALEATSPPEASLRWCDVNGKPRPQAPELTTPWQTHDDTQINEAYADLRKQVPPIPPMAAAESLDLPVVEVPATGRKKPVYAVLISGDGGWAGLDEEVADALAASGITVIGLDSLRYFWKERTPESTASDIDRLIRYYNRRLGIERTMLIGYSQGADVLPFVLNRLPAQTRSSIAVAAPIALSAHAAFEFHVGAWFGQSGSMPTLPEVLKLAGQGLLVIYGKEDEDALGPQLSHKDFHLLELPGSHHFDGDYQSLAKALIAALPSRL